MLSTMTALVLSAALGAGHHTSAARAPGQSAPGAPSLGSEPPTVIASGTAIVTRAPDVAHVSLGIESRAASSRDAQRQNAEKIAAVMKRLTELSIPADARRTTGIRLEQEYDVANGRRTPRDFVARNGLEVRVDDIARAGEVADAAVQAGATSIDGIRFDLKDRTAVEREAIRLAVGDARARAEAAATGAGRTIDRILKIEEGERTPLPRPMIGLTGPMRAEAVTAIEPGLIDVRASVTLTASIK
jgi:uncharacterized protein YggE